MTQNQDPTNTAPCPECSAPSARRKVKALKSGATSSQHQCPEHGYFTVRTEAEPVEPETTEVRPTRAVARGFQGAFDHFNEVLFDGQLPQCLITLRTFGKARGYFSGGRFVAIGDDVEIVHEIALDPKQFMDRTALEVLSTLAHEMAHAWQHDFGKPSRNGYHNKEWGSKMKDIGLYPSDTAQPGGKETGQRVSHYIVEGGRYETVATEWLKTADFKGTDWSDVEGWLDLSPSKRKALLPTGAAGTLPTRKAPTGKSGKRTKYSCVACGTNAWGKGGIRLYCAGTEAEEHEPMQML